VFASVVWNAFLYIYVDVYIHMYTYIQQRARCPARANVYCKRNARRDLRHIRGCMLLLLFLLTLTLTLNPMYIYACKHTSSSGPTAPPARTFTVRERLKREPVTGGRVCVSMVVWNSFLYTDVYIYTHTCIHISSGGGGGPPPEIFFVRKTRGGTCGGFGRYMYHKNLF